MNIAGGIAVHDLSIDEKEFLKRATVSGMSPHSAAGSGEYIEDCQRIAASLPDVFQSWSNSAHMQKIGLLRNLPIDAPMPSTPVMKDAHSNRRMVVDGLIGVIASFFGDIYTIEGKSQNQLIQDIHPVPGDEYTQLGSSSKSELDWHVEEAFHPYRPSWLLLLCLRGDSHAITKLARLSDFGFDARQLDSLRESRFRLRVDETYGHGAESLEVNIPIITGSTSDPQIVLDPAYTVMEDAQDIATIAAIKTVADRVQQQVVLAPGECLVFDNRRVLHARSPFAPRMDGSDRWLKRVFTLEDCKERPKLRNGLIPFFVA